MTGVQTVLFRSLQEGFKTPSKSEKYDEVQIEEEIDEQNQALADKFSPDYNCLIGGSLETIDEKSKSELEVTASEISSKIGQIKCFMCNTYINKAEATEHIKDCNKSVVRESRESGEISSILSQSINF